MKLSDNCKNRKKAENSFLLRVLKFIFFPKLLDTPLFQRNIPPPRDDLRRVHHPRLVRQEGALREAGDGNPRLAARTALTQREAGGPCDYICESDTQDAHYLMTIIHKMLSI